MVIYDGTDLIKYHVEVYWSPFTYLTFFAVGNYNDYKPAGIVHPWHKPAIDVNFTTHYNFKKKIYADLELIAMGKRYTPNWNNQSEPIVLDPIVDVNLKLEYRYSNVVSAFVDIYNLTSQNYSIWNQYPVQKINVLLGVTYKF